MILQNETGDVLKKLGVIETGHRVLNSGLCTDTFVDIEKLFVAGPTFGNLLCGQLAEKIHKAHISLDFVVGLQTGGEIVARHVVNRLNGIRQKTTLLITAYKSMTPGKFFLQHSERTYLLNKRVFLIDDVATTGGSLQKVRHLVEKSGGKVVGMGALINRGRSAEDLGIPHFFDVYQLHAHVWNSWECKECKTCKP